MKRVSVLFFIFFTAISIFSCFGGKDSDNSTSTNLTGDYKGWIYDKEETYGCKIIIKFKQTGNDLTGIMYLDKDDDGNFYENGTDGKVAIDATISGSTISTKFEGEGVDLLTEDLYNGIITTSNGNLTLFSEFAADGHEDDIDYQGEFNVSKMGTAKVTGKVDPKEFNFETEGARVNIMYDLEHAGDGVLHSCEIPGTAGTPADFTINNLPAGTFYVVATGETSIGIYEDSSLNPKTITLAEGEIIDIGTISLRIQDDDD